MIDLEVWQFGALFIVVGVLVIAGYLYSARETGRGAPAATDTTSHPLAPQPDLRAGTPGARLPSRSEVRRMVADHHAESLELLGAGENAHHHSLDHMDKVRAYAALLSTQDSIAFLQLYAEESSALAAHESERPRVRE